MKSFNQPINLKFYFDASEYSPVKEYLEKMSDPQQSKAIALIKRMAESGKIHDKTKFRHEGNQIYAFKPQPDRILCFFFRGGKIIMTNAYYKKTDKLPISEKQRALKYRKDYIERIEKDEYYEK